MIYLDNAATTAMYPECLEDFRKYGVDEFFNPSAYYAPAGVNAHVVAAARKTILSALGAPEFAVHGVGERERQHRAALLFEA